MHFNHAPALYTYIAPLPVWGSTPTSSLAAPAPISPATNNDILFGASVATNGSYVVVGAPGTTLSTGAVYVFDVVTGTLLHTLDISAPATGDMRGYAVAAHGQYAVVGAYGREVGATTDTGEVYVFDIATGAPVSTLVNPSPVAGDYFGVSVSISGNYVVVGVSMKDVGATNTGQAYVFNTTTGALVSTLVNPNPTANDSLGGSVGISGNYVIVGAQGEDQGATTNIGKAYVFNATTGALVSTLVNPSPVANDYFGMAVAISGTTAVVGSMSTGEVYVFNAETGTLLRTCGDPNASAGNQYGTTVAIDGDYIVIGAPYADFGSTVNPGAAYVFSAATGQRLTTLTPTPRTAEYHFGNAVAIRDSCIVVGARDEDRGGYRDSGAAYIFKLV